MPSSFEEKTTIHVRQVKNSRDEESFEWLVRRFSPVLKVSGRAMNVQRSDLDDIMQETWVVCYQKIESLTPYNGRITPVFVKFLTSTFRFKVIEAVRKSIRDGNAEDASERLGGIDANTTAAINRAIRSEQADALNAAIDELSPDDAKLIQLRAFEFMTFAQVSERLGIPLQTAASRYKTLLASLRKLLPNSIFDELEG